MPSAPQFPVARILAVLIGLVALSLNAAPALAGVPKLHPRAAGDQVMVTLSGVSERRSVRYLMGGTIVARSRAGRPAVVVRGLSRVQRAPWRTVQARVGKSRRVVARARFAAARRTRQAPTVVMTTAPDTSTTSTTATFTFTVSNGSVTCSLDGAAYGSCSSPRALTDLASGRHSFVVRAANRYGATSLRHDWTVVAPPPVIDAIPSPVSPSLAAPTPSGSPSGAAMPVGDLPGWKQVYTDDFTRDVPVGSFPGAVSDKWDAYPDGWKDTSRNGTYAPSKVVSIRNGLMDMFLRTENGVPLVAAPAPKVSGGTAWNGQLYGRYAVRFRADPLPGYHTAWLLWPTSEVWPGDGEIDFPEGDLNDTMCAFMHRQDGSSATDQDAFCSSFGYQDWHTAILEWGPTATRFIIDGQVIGTSTSRIPSTPMRWVLQTETAYSVRPDPNVAGHVQVDWVAVWRRT